ncbi:hypothetical protein OHA72_44305 [Dactylosporangium sp. NBC_01737]|uniref:hypothetical protein n=1 Tax=Dactylosporangium sp. NBC_01737 TaxID=2975959 RepID=UPI002E0FEC1F|nr:hypothetical protein OHA72_44305 [Dactylosporangium sp. NBC_01737]
MNDDEVLGAVKMTLADVQMDRPLEAIEQRGQAWRRNRRLLGVAAGGGLAAAAALALTLPMVNQPAGTTRAGSGPAAGGSTTGTTAAMQPVAFTVTRQADSTVKLTLELRQVFDAEALQRALADAGIPAEVRTGVLCAPRDSELPEAEQAYRFEQVTSPDGAVNRYVLVIAPSKMPEASRLYFSILMTDGGEHTKAGKAGVFLVSDDDPMDCRSTP